MQNTGRNAPCPCSSGKKYKKYCLAKTYSPPGREESIKARLVQDIPCRLPLISLKKFLKCPIFFS